MKFYELNFDGLVGPTHLFSGLAHGNLASATNRGLVSRPKQAALQGLAKMRLLYNLGLKQAIIPPQLRPNLKFLRANGYAGSTQQILQDAYHSDRELFAKACSASSMWAANAATVSPSLDTEDGLLHLTVANLLTNTHRSLEAESTYEFFTKVFSSSRFCIHSPSPNPDEGAANHCRLAPGLDSSGLEILVYSKPRDVYKFPSRQSYEASLTIAKQHRLRQFVLIEQNPEVIDQGVFHNDVISTTNGNVFLYHQRSFVNTDESIAKIEELYCQSYGSKPICIKVSDDDLTVQDAVSSYLFNSQILSLESGMLLLAPIECKKSTRVKSYIDRLLLDPSNPINQVEYIDLNQSMQNGGGPACLRLRVLMSEDEMTSINQGVILNDKSFDEIQSWIEAYYQDELCLEDLAQESFYLNYQEALRELYDLLSLNPSLG